MSREFTAQYIEKSYNRWASHYDSDFAPHQWIGPEFLHATLSRHFNAEAQGVLVLDVGVGTGLLSKQFRSANPAAHITGIDVSGGMIAACKEKTLPTIWWLPIFKTIPCHLRTDNSMRLSLVAFSSFLIIPKK